MLWARMPIDPGPVVLIVAPASTVTVTVPPMAAYLPSTLPLSVALLPSARLVLPDELAMPPPPPTDCATTPWALAPVVVMLPARSTLTAPAPTLTMLEVHIVFAVSDPMGREGSPAKPPPP